MGAIAQYIIAGLIGLGAAVYLVYYLRKSTKATHDCPDCGVSEIVNAKKSKKHTFRKV